MKIQNFPAIVYRQVNRNMESTKVKIVKNSQLLEGKLKEEENVLQRYPTLRKKEELKQQVSFAGEREIHGICMLRPGKPL